MLHFALNTAFTNSQGSLKMFLRYDNTVNHVLLEQIFYCVNIAKHWCIRSRVILEFVM